MKLPTLSSTVSTITATLSSLSDGHSPPDEQAVRASAAAATAATPVNSFFMSSSLDFLGHGLGEDSFVTTTLPRIENWLPGHSPGLMDLTPVCRRISFYAC